MSKFALCRLDNRLVDHLQRGGSLSDQVGRQLLVKFVLTAMSEPEVAAACHRLRFDADDLCCLYADMVNALLPNPAVRAGGFIPMLAASVPFVEPLRIEAMLNQISRDIGPDADAEQRRNVIRCHAEGNARLVFETHQAARGAPRWSVDPRGTGAPSAGCFSVIVAAIGVRDTLGGGSVDIRGSVCPAALPPPVLTDPRHP